MKPFFTVVVPTLNEEKFIPKLLYCLAAQKTKNFEVVIVDATSTDKTKEIILSYKDSFPLHFHQVEKGNLSLQKNIGGAIGQGEYLMFFDADMLIGPFFTAIAEREVRRRKGFVFIPYVYPIEKKEYPEVYAAISFFNQIIGLSHETNKPFSAGPPQIWERNVFLKIGGFDQIFGEDHQIIRKAQNWGIRVRQIPQLKVRFSLRRLKKQGRLKLFTHFIRAHIHLLFNDTLGKPFEYEMGGQLYAEKKNALKKQLQANDMEQALTYVKKFLSNLLKVG